MADLFGPAPARIAATRVPPAVPAAGPIRALLMGEAPGPRGASQSGVPFWGDAAGMLTYRALAQVGAAVWNGPPDAVALSGAALRDRGIVPTLRGVMLTNAFDACPTTDGRRFRAPTRAELQSPANLARLATEFDAALARGLVQVVTLGRVAERMATAILAARQARAVRLVALPHPSAQGLLMAAPNRGAGMKLADLGDAWVARLAHELRYIAR